MNDLRDLQGPQPIDPIDLFPAAVASDLIQIKAAAWQICKLFWDSRFGTLAPRRLRDASAHFLSRDRAPPFQDEPGE